jgi:hypothetical protein
MPLANMDPWPDHVPAHAAGQVEMPVPTGRTMVKCADSIEVLAQCCTCAGTLSVDLARIGGGAEGVLWSPVCLIRRYTVSCDLKRSERFE